MLAAIGFATIIILLAVMMTKKVTPAFALTVVPVLACIVAGQAGSIGSYVGAGLQSVISTTAMLTFALIFFNTMMDAGAFDPIINAAVKFAGNDPVKILLAVFVVACASSLDGNGATTLIITYSALYPIYKKMRMRPMYFAIIMGLATGIWNILPWGGPTMRAMTVYEASLDEVFMPMVIPMAVGLLLTAALAVFLGKKEAKRLATLAPCTEDNTEIKELKLKSDMSLKRPKLVIFNLGLIVVTIAVMVAGWLTPTCSMIFATFIGFIVNYPAPKIQNQLISKYGNLCLNPVITMLAAGIFTGIMKNSGMLDAMAEAMAAAIPDTLSRIAPVLVGVIGVPASLVFTADAWYYSILPTLTTAVAGAGVSAMSVVHASLLGQMTVGYPGSPLLAGSFLLPSLLDIDFPDYQKVFIPIAWGISILMLVAALFIGCVTF